MREIPKGKDEKQDRETNIDEVRGGGGENTYRAKKGNKKKRKEGKRYTISCRRSKGKKNEKWDYIFSEHRGDKTREARRDTTEIFSGCITPTGKLGCDS